MIRISGAKLTRNSGAPERGFGGGKHKRGPACPGAGQTKDKNLSLLVLPHSPLFSRIHQLYPPHTLCFFPRAVSFTHSICLTFAEGPDPTPLPIRSTPFSLLLTGGIQSLPHAFPSIVFLNFPMTPPFLWIYRILNFTRSCRRLIISDHSPRCSTTET